MPARSKAMLGSSATAPPKPGTVRLAQVVPPLVERRASAKLVPAPSERTQAAASCDGLPP